MAPRKPMALARAVLRLHEQEAHTVGMISDRLGLDPRTVKRMLGRARAERRDIEQGRTDFRD